MSLPHLVAKRKMVRDGFVRDHGELILQYDKLVQIIPDPCVPSSKRTWEKQMYHVRTVARGTFKIAMRLGTVQVCTTTSCPSLRNSS